MEFVFVVLILGVVFALALPRLYARIAPDPLRVGARELAQTIRRLRTHAISAGQLVQLRLELPEGKWKVEGMDAEGRWRALAEAPVPAGGLSQGVRLHKVRTGRRGEVVQGEVPLRFLPTGETERALLYLIDDNRQERTLVVHPFLNRVDIHHGRAATTRQ